MNSITIEWERLDVLKDFGAMMTMWYSLNDVDQKLILHHMCMTEPVFGPYNIRSYKPFQKEL